MRNNQGLTITERINKDIELAKMTENEDQRALLVHMAIAAAELAVDFKLITFQEWGDLTNRAFSLI
jgi:hypothetical protein